MAYINQEEIFAATNGGLDVILWKYPSAQAAVERPGTKFKIRGNEKTASASLKRLENGIYVVTDFGGDQKPLSAIGVVMLEENCDFKTAINLIAERFNIAPDVKKTVLAKADFSKREAGEDEIEGSYDFDIKDSFSENDLKEIFAEHVIDHVLWEAKLNNKGTLPEDPYKALREVCKRYHLFSLKSFTQIKDRKALVTSSNDHYPIFLFDFGDWKRIYQPRDPEKRFRFRYVGSKPKDVMFGIKQCTKAFNDLNPSEDNLDEEADEKRKPKDLKEIIVCSGDRDALNVAALGYNVVWLNSETAKLTKDQYVQLSSKTKNIYNLPDIDVTGTRQAHELAMAWLDIKTIWLPNELRDKKDFRGNPCKDIRDFLKYYSRKAFQDLIDAALPYRFWDAEPKFDRKGNFLKNGYAANNACCYNFLSRNGFYQLATQNDQKDIFVKVNGNIVEEVTDKKIRKHITDFLIEKKSGDLELRNTFYRTTQLSAASLENLPHRTIDFTDYDENTQYMFFKNRTWKITKDQIEEFRPGDVDKHVWNQEVIPHRVEKLEDYFRVKYNDEKEQYEIEVLDTKCLFFQFIINTTRMHWKVDAAVDHEKNPVAGVTEFRELTPEEKREQDMHLINRLYTLGYLLHRYKDASRSWAVWALENKITEESVSDGGSGKSIFMNFAANFMKSEIIGARDQELTRNKHLLENVTEHTDYVLFDDCHEYINFSFFFPMITGPWTINPKNTRSFTLMPKEAPKMGFSSNYYPRNADPSTERRLLYTVFSDYYHHGPSDEFPVAFTPKEDFGKNLIDHFTEEEWNRAINLAAQCVKLYLNYDKITPPMSNVTKRKLLAIMTETFQSWADVFFSPESGNLNKALVRDVIQEECIKKNNLHKWSAQKFMKAMHAWCTFNNHMLNPKRMHNSKNRIIEKRDDKTVEMIFVETRDAILPDVAGIKTTPDIGNLPF